MTNRISEIKLGVIGGDARQIVMAKMLAEAGAETALASLEGCPGDVGEATRCRSADAAIKGASAVLLPMPVSPDGVMLNAPFSPCEIRLSELFSHFTEGQLCIGGRFDGATRMLAREFGIRLADYTERPELAAANAVSTAEGALEIILRELPVTVNGARICIVGFGRIGKALTRLMLGIGANVTVTARRKEELVWISALGAEARHTAELCGAGKFDVVVNTVPALVLGERELDAIGGALVVDLASSPGGVELEAARARGIRVIHALSLPGKTAPVSAGRALGECALAILRDEGVISP